MTDAPIVTRDEIEAGLRLLGLDAGAVVEVHSSLSAFGRVEGGAAAVVDALMTVVSEQGTIVMSSYTVSPAVPLTEEEIARGITWKVRILPEDSQGKTGLGAVVEEFKRRPGVVCGTGVHRTCAWGHQADRHRDGYEHLLEIDGWALLLGVGIGSCSSMHAAERVPLPAAIEACFTIPEAGEPRFGASGSERQRRGPGPGRRDYDPKSWGIGYGGTPDDAWGKVYTEADRRGLIRHHTIGRAACHLFRARAVVGIYEEWRRTDPFGLFGADPLSASSSGRRSPRCRARSSGRPRSGGCGRRRGPGARRGSP